MSKHNSAANFSQEQAAVNGAGVAQPTAAPEREANGQFAAGNKGGPGNPFGRTMAARRRVVAEAVDEETLRAIIATLVGLAIGGDVGAAKLVLQYAVGKPAAVAEPDRVEIEEWELHQKSAIHKEEIDWVLNGAPIRTANVTTAVLTPEKEADEWSGAYVVRAGARPDRGSKPRNLESKSHTLCKNRRESEIESLPANDIASGLPTVRRPFGNEWARELP